MRHGDLRSGSIKNIGVCINALLDPPKTFSEKLKFSFTSKWHKETAKHLWHPRFENINRLRPVSYRHNLYVFTDYPRSYHGLLHESLQPLGFVGMVWYKSMVGLRQEVERYNLMRFLASSLEQVSVLGEHRARLFDLSWQQEKEIFRP